jgi:hypothetical protein
MKPLLRDLLATHAAWEKFGHRAPSPSGDIPRAWQR